jgi:electron transport complex protein RnfE
MGIGFTLALMTLGALREVLGHGTLFGGAQLMLGSWAAGLELEVIHHYRGFLLAVLPPGAFFGLGLLVAIKNMIDQRRKDSAKATARVSMEAEAAG